MQVAQFRVSAKNRADKHGKGEAGLSVIKYRVQEKNKLRIIATDEKNFKANIDEYSTAIV